MPDLEHDTAVQAAARTATVLVVDDEPSVLSALRRLFRMNGYATEQATSGADALRIMKEQPIDLVISDMRMPEMDGAAFLEAARHDHPDTVRILLTGYSDIGSTVAAVNRGEIHRYVAKPWDDHDLLLIVAEALNKRALERHNAELLALTQQQNEQLQLVKQSLEERVAERTAELEESNRRLGEVLEDLRNNFTMAVTVFTGLLEMRQSGIAGHARRVAELSRRMAEKLGLDEHAQHDVELGALFHDIGKLGFGDEMLGKPISLYTDEEMARYRHHPLDGEAALMPLDKLHGVALMVRQHHERVDGRGYPDGLYGPAISVGAKIIAAASDYDGLTNGIQAEQQYTGDKARAAIRDGLGTHYDLRTVNALFAVLDEQDAQATADVEIDVRDLQRGMILSADLVSSAGAILLPKGFRFDAKVIQKLTDLVSRNNVRLNVRVLLKSVAEAGQAARKAAPQQTARA